MLSTPVRCRTAVALLILGSVGLNFAYLACNCPLELAPDEAHYWHWSRRLDWSYYSKGPLIAWLIRGSCELFGEWSTRLVGTEMLAVRLPALASHTLLLAGLYSLSNFALGNGRSAVGLVAFAVVFPPVSAAAIISTIDPPYLACWCWALLAVAKAVVSGRFRWWLVAGGCSLLGVLAKYPMLLLPLCAGGFLVVHRREELRRAGFWTFAALTLLGCVPVLVWNAQHEWPSVRHVSAQVGVVEPKKPLEPWIGLAAFVGGQFGLLLGFGFAAVALASWKYRRTQDPALGLLWWCTVPIWWMFASASVRTGGQVNWPAPAYIGGAVLAGAWLRDQLDGTSPIRRRIVACGIVATCVVSVTLSVLLHYPSLMRPTLASVVGPSSAEERPRIRRLDPTCRLNGWRTLADEVDRLRIRVTVETGREPVIAAMAWTTPGELAFYCRHHPDTYSFGVVLGDRHSQYDFWRPNPVFDAQGFRGRTFLYVGDEIPDAEQVFDRVELPRRVIHRDRGIPVASWTIWVCHGYRGFERGPSPRAGY